MGQEDPLEKEMATYSGILASEIPWTEEPASYNPWGCKQSNTTEQLNNNNAVIKTSRVVKLDSKLHLLFSLMP